MNMNVDMILEIGVNHENSMENALQLVESAARTGAKTVKFQTYTAEKLAAENSPSYWDLSEEPTSSQKKLFKKYDSFTVSDYELIAQRANSLGLEFMTTCFDEDWADKLDHLLKRYKIASADLTNVQLLKHIARKNKPILLSTGAATFGEIEEAVRIIKSQTSADVTLLHCVLNYPTAPHNANLLRILQLRDTFPNLAIGYSDHTRPKDSFSAIGLAFVLGASTIEKHFTFDKSLKGNDHYHAFDEDDVKKVFERIVEIQELLEYEEQKFIEIQEKARSYARRGIYARVGIEAGHQIGNQHLISLRPIPTNGISAAEIESVIGKQTKRKIDVGNPILWDDLE
jgi:sialic acid synthase SpsE